MDIINNVDGFFIQLALDIRCGFLNVFFGFFSYIGNSGLCWIALGVALTLIRKTRKAGLAVLISLLVTWIVTNLLLKNIIARERPFITYEFLDTVISHPTDFSFPSGHAASSFTAAAALLFYNKRAGLGAFILALMIALSRLYFTVHYFSDVLAGAVIGILFAAVIAGLIFPKVKKAYYRSLYRSDKTISIGEGFEATPITDELFERINGVSFKPNELVFRDMLCRLSVRHIGFDKKPHTGELIVRKTVARPLLKIFKRLYERGYEIEKLKLIDCYGADDDKSMTDNNSSAFCFRTIANQKTVSNHALGLAVDINPLYNPYIQNGVCLPKAAEPYADRTRDFPHKLDKKDYAVRLFKSYGFHWGGDWKGKSVDWQHFDKPDAR